MFFGFLVTKLNFYKLPQTFVLSLQFHSIIFYFVHQHIVLGMCSMVLTSYKTEHDYVILVHSDRI